MVMRVICFFGVRRRRRRVRWDEGVGEREDKEEAECLCPSIFLPEEEGIEEHDCLT
jgi:hypothetical protein